MARQQADMEVMRENVQRLNEKLNGIQLEQQNLARDIEALRKAPSQDQATRSRIESLERQIQALDAARDTDRKQIVDDVSRKVAALVGANSGGGSSAGGGRSAGTSETGYEHIVKAGESLSAIAKAYKVSVSAIMKANGIKSTDKIRVGQKLFIPQG